MSMMTQAAESQYVTFSLGQEIFAVPVTAVREILDHGQCFHIPHGPAYLLGLRDVRGEGVPIIDLRLRLGMSKTEATHHTRILVMDIAFHERVLTLGLVADRVFEVAAFRHDQVGPAPDLGISWKSDYINGVIRRDTGFVVLIDLVRLFSDQDMSHLHSMGEHAYA